MDDVLINRRNILKFVMGLWVASGLTNIPLALAAQNTIIKKVILYEVLNTTEPLRTPEELNKIVSETKAEMIFRAGMRIDTASLHGANFDRLKTNISAIKLKNPDIIIIGNLYFQQLRRASELDDITGQTYTSQQVYDTMAFDPLKFGITTIDKEKTIDKKTYQCVDTSPCVGAPGETQKKILWVSDITIPEVQTLFLHQAQRLLETGVDGIWIDGLFFNAIFLSEKWLDPTAAQRSLIQRTIDAALYVCTEIKNIKTVYGKTPLISTWYSHARMPYFKASIYWHPKFFDFVTIAAPNPEEIQKMAPMQDYDTIIKNVKDPLSYGDVPIIGYMDWGFNKDALWYFSQWYPEYLDACSSTNFEKRKLFQIAILEKFSVFLKSKGISFAYPVHGGGMCTPGIPCTDEQNGVCIAKSFGTWHIYDSLAPEFQTYNTIVSLMNPNMVPPDSGTNIISVTSTGGIVGNQSTVPPDRGTNNEWLLLILGGVGALMIYKFITRKSSENKEK